MSIKVHCDMTECNNLSSTEIIPGGLEVPAGWARIMWVGGHKASPQAEAIGKVRNKLRGIPGQTTAVFDDLASMMHPEAGALVSRRFEAYMCPDCMGKLALGTFAEIPSNVYPG